MIEAIIFILGSLFGGSVGFFVFATFMQYHSEKEKPIAPSVDTASVVWCCECRFRTDSGRCGHSRMDMLPMSSPNGFCSYGKQKVAK